MPCWEMESLTGEAAQARLQETGIAIVPLGAMETHGPHLPVGTDNYISRAVARKLAERVSAVVLPALSYGQVWSLYGFPGTLTVDDDALADIICGIGRSLRQLGVPILALVNAHMGNLAAMKAAARVLDAEGGPLTFYFSHPGMGEAADRVRESPRFHSTLFHACEIETSMMLYLAPDMVDMSKAIRAMPEVPPDFDYRPTRWREMTDTGVMGDATLATAEKGRAVIEATIDNMTAVLTAARVRLRG
ncbi:MAG TPA: creatininase family protein [Symbiobacteriaceae bacterium]|nr:creatininase family protein [Symbiobacteriaceae bacterium]